MKVKFIETVPFVAEETINEWLKENPDIKIMHVTQSNSNALMHFTIWYEKQILLREEKTK